MDMKAEELDPLKALLSDVADELDELGYKNPNTPQIEEAGKQIQRIRENIRELADDLIAS
jgi:nucleotide-binding universal stress UspA family protein